MPPRPDDQPPSGSGLPGMSKLRGRQQQARKSGRTKPPPKHPPKHPPVPPAGSGSTGAQAPAFPEAPEQPTETAAPEPPKHGETAAETPVVSEPSTAEKPPVTQEKPPVSSPRPPIKPEKPVSTAAETPTSATGGQDPRKGKPVAAAKTDAALKAASDLALAWAAGARKMSRRTTELVGALRKGEQLGVPRELLVASLVAAQRRTGEEFPEEVWRQAGLAPPE